MQEKASAKNQSVEKLFSIIEVMAAEPLPMRLQDIAAAVNIPASTALRFVNTLQTIGYVRQDPHTLRYAPTLKFTHLGAQIASHLSLRDLVRPYLEDLANYSGECCCLAEEQDMHVVTLDVVSGQNDMLQIVRKPGARTLMHCSGVGKLLLLNRTSAELEAYTRITALKSLTPHSISSFAQLTDALRTVRLSGYAMDDEESALGVRSLAVPIKDYSGRAVCGISIAAPSARFTDERVRELLPKLRETGSAISALLGGQYPQGSK